MRVCFTFVTFLVWKKTTFKENIHEGLLYIRCILGLEINDIDIKRIFMKVCFTFVAFLAWKKTRYEVKVVKKLGVDNWF